MKKINKFAILLCLLLFAPFFLFGCNENEKEKIFLTTENIEDYIIINKYFTDGIYTEYEDVEEVTHYWFDCIGHIEITRKIDCTFYNCEITFSVEKEGIDLFIHAILDFNGNSNNCFSYFVFSEYFGYPMMSANIISVSSDSYVLI